MKCGPWPCTSTANQYGVITHLEMATTMYGILHTGTRLGYNKYNYHDLYIWFWSRLPPASSQSQLGCGLTGGLIAVQEARMRLLLINPISRMTKHRSLPSFFFLPECGEFLETWPQLFLPIKKKSSYLPAGFRSIFTQFTQNIRKLSIVYYRVPVSKRM